MGLPRHISLAILFIHAVVFSAAQEAHSETVLHQKIGNAIIPIIVEQYGKDRDLLLINVHDDETTAVNAARKLLLGKGGTLIRIDNAGQRIIRFRLGGRKYGFDPNRIFTAGGIVTTLRKHGRYSTAAMNEVNRFALRLLKLVQKNKAAVIALHNNKDLGLSINDFLPGGERHRDSKKLHLNPALDADDFFITTVSNWYDSLSKRDYNVVLQNFRSAEQDGSLSLYCEKKNIPYLNCETQHENVAAYEQMLTDAEALIRKKKLPGTAH